ncbi:hypothetical protein J6590_057915 [Homalodisca vitripennis]|nr:hypothetical protein J6590_057915 [Homalodisca vitripennis]
MNDDGADRSESEAGRVSVVICPESPETTGLSKVVVLLVQPIAQRWYCDSGRLLLEPTQVTFLIHIGRRNVYLFTSVS